MALEQATADGAAQMRGLSAALELEAWAPILVLMPTAVGTSQVTIFHEDF